MDRRAALGKVALLFGGTIVGANAFLSRCTPATKSETVSASGLIDQSAIAFLNEIGEVILPGTSASPGARAANVGAFMNVIVSDCYSVAEQQVFMSGIDAIRQAAKQKYNDTFNALTSEQKQQMLKEIDLEQREYHANKKAEAPVHYFTMMKQLTIWGYFTSEVGSSQALRYVEVPGRYEGCIDYKKGDKAWAVV